MRITVDEAELLDPAGSPTVARPSGRRRQSIAGRRTIREIGVQRWALWSIAAIGLIMVVAESCFSIHWSYSDAQVESNTMASLLEIGSALQRDIGRVVRPAMSKTQLIAMDPETIAALKSGDRARQ